MKHLRIRVFGIVQGVAFRGSARNTAKSYKITGLIRNEPDGSVYIEAEGLPDQLEKFVAWCKKGPDFANVDDVKIEEGTIKNYISFDIKY